MSELRVLVIAFTIFLICSRVSAMVNHEHHGHDDEHHHHEKHHHVDEEQRVQNLLLDILKSNLQEARYAAFELTIKAYHEDCYRRAYKIIADSDRHDKDQQLDRLTSLYENHVKDYPKQNRQAILDNQIAEPISRNAGTATNALCHQMHGFTL